MAARTIEDLELAGNALCLDFANTVNSRTHPVHDYLASYADLLDWSERVGSVPREVIRALRPKVTLPAAVEVVAEAGGLRDAVFAVFAAIAGGRQPAPDDLERLSAAYAAAMGRARINRSGDGYEVDWPSRGPASLQAPLWPVAGSAGELLLSGPLARVGACPGCGWLFLDVSRNGTRRWCNMATCGSRDKMARYHQRQRLG